MYKDIKDIPNEEIVSYWLQFYKMPATKNVYKAFDNYVLTEMHHREPDLEIDALKVLRTIVHLNVDKTKFGITEKGINKLKTNQQIALLAELTHYPQYNGIMSNIPQHLQDFLKSVKFAKQINDTDFQLNNLYLTTDWDFDESEPIEFQEEVGD